MTGPQNGRSSRSPDAIIFDLILIAFAAVMVAASLGLRTGVGSVPLLVGIPTLVGALVILAMDLFPRMRLPEADPGEKAGAMDLRSLVAAAGEAGEDDAEVRAAPDARRRQVAFTAWVVGFVILATLTSFYVAVPVALTGILVAVRLPWPAIVLTVGGTLAAFYGLFDLFLGVRL